MRFPTSSIIVSTYNRPDALAKCLQSILRQDLLPDEIVIADDGSGEPTAQLIHEFKRISAIPVVHVWHEDRGYQLAGIRNRSFAAASGEYLIQIDGDLVLDKFFIRDHLEMAKKGTFVSGTRAYLDESLTQDILKGEVKAEAISAGSNHVLKSRNALRSGLLKRLVYLFQRRSDNYKHVLGCNMAFWKEDLVRVNGYDESFVGWGKEDNELAVRLQNAGLKLRFIKFGAVVYHLYHKVADLSSVPANEEKLRQTIKERLTYAAVGIRNYLKNQ